MLSIYNTDLKTDKFEKIKEFRPGSWISLVNPTQEEIETVCTNLKIEDEFIKYPLDYEEQARIDIEDDMTLFVIDVPIIEDSKDREIIYNNAFRINSSKRSVFYFGFFKEKQNYREF